jgi:hypothetical protein
LDFVKLFLDLRVEAEELGVADGYLFSGWKDKMVLIEIIFCKFCHGVPS